MSELAIDYLKRNDVQYKENLQMKTISSIRIGASARVVAFPDSQGSMIGLLDFLWKHKIRYKIVGRMTNLLPPDEKYDGVLIKTDRMSDYSVSDNVITADAGVLVPKLALTLSCLSGLEELSGIPTSLGGALIGNAGAYGRETSDIVTEIYCYDPESGEVEIIKASDADFSYRHSRFKTEQWVILGAKLCLTHSDAQSVRERIRGYRERRLKSQPVDMPSLGSTFKRPSENISAARLIDECGIKGYRIGGAEISEHHAGFIVNRGGATACDYIRLSEYAEKCVFDRFKIRLEREVEIMKGGGGDVCITGAEERDN